jgi:hypothetical protein
MPKTTPPASNKDPSLATLLISEQSSEIQANRIDQLETALQKFEDQEEDIKAYQMQIAQMKDLLNSRDSTHSSAKKATTHEAEILTSKMQEEKEENVLLQRLRNENNTMKNLMVQQQQQQQQQQQNKKKALRFTSPSSSHKSLTTTTTTPTNLTRNHVNYSERRRRVVAMISVMKEQVRSLREDVDTARQELLMDPENETRRIMANQYSKRYEAECKHVNELEMELNHLNKKVKSIDKSNNSNNHQTSKSRSPTTRSVANSKIIRSPRYRNPNQFYIKGKNAEKKGLLYSNWNREKRCQWQVKKESPSPQSYRPNYKTCQDTYDYNWDDDPKAKSRKNQQVKLLQARNRRGSTLANVSPVNKKQYALALVDEKDDSSKASGKARLMEHQLSNATRRASVAEKK